eukprot:9250177-Ditylum_brightwellii.AAC.1
MEYYMSTADGLLPDTNKHSKESLVHGSGQGATDSLANWGIQLSVGLKLCNKKAYGCSIQDPTGTMKQQRNTDMFVDDMTTQHSGGDLLESVKSRYSLMIWEFNRKGKPSLKKEKDMDPNT